MKKYCTRFFACFMACVIAFNVIAIPKAKAATIIDATEVFGSNITAAFARVVGVKPLTSSFSATGSGFTSLATKYTVATGAFANASLFFTAIAAGAKINEKHLELTKQSYAYMVDFFNWVIEEFALLGEDGTPVTEPAVVYQSTNVFLADGSPLFLSTVDIDNSSFQYSYDGTVYTTKTGYSFNGYVSGSYYIVGIYDASGNEKAKLLYDNGTSTIIPTFHFKKPSSDSIYIQAYKDGVVESSTLISPKFSTVFGDLTSESLSVSLEADYVGSPEILENQQIELNIEDVPDLDEDGAISEEEFNEYIPAAIYAGDYAPTYEITVVEDSGVDTNPDAGTDADTELGFLERIAVGVESLIDGIVDGIANIFAPDPALMTEISDTFNSKFGFVSTLHRLGTDLLSIDATSAPPVVYIHLEDAEGSIYYGETVKALDMSWYARYKEDGDRIIGGFLWLGFLWLLFKRAPAIINGAEMVTEYGSDLADGERRRRR